MKQEKSVNYLGGSFPKELSDNKFLGAIVLPNNEEIAFDDDNIEILLYKENNEALLALTGFTDNKEFLNGHIFLAKENVIVLIVWE